jgi:4-amino-4-deoxy-L-arabinose transferase-like glycosyltransferase
VIGIGFNMKMLQAYMVVPAFFVYYILAAKINLKKKAGFLTSATAVMLAISLSWASCRGHDSCWQAALYRKQPNKLHFRACLWV